MDQTQIRQFYFKYKYLVWSALSGLSSVAILALVIIPQFLGYLNIKNQITDIYDNVHTLDVKAEGLDKIDNNLTSKDIQVALSVLPTDQDAPLAMAVLQSLANQSGLVVEYTNYAASKSSGGKSFRIKVTVLGPLSSIKNFLNGLQSSSRIFQVESMSAKFQKGQLGVEAQIPLLAFYDPNFQANASSSNEVPKLNTTEEELLSHLSQLVSQQAALAFEASQIAASASAQENLGPGGLLLNLDVSSVPLGKDDPFQ